MSEPAIKPLDTQQRMRQARRQRLILKWMRRVLRNQHVLRGLFWIAKVLWHVVRFFFFSDHS